MLFSSIVSILRRPILALHLKNRTLCLTITGATILHFGLLVLGLPSWQSPFRNTFGIPDPGGGLSRAILALLRGDWQTSLTFHAFAPLFIIALTLIAFAAILPFPLRDKIIYWVEYVEVRTGLTAILLMGLVIYWLVRLLILREAFIELIVGSDIQ